MVFNPAIFILCFAIIVDTLRIGSQSFVVFTIDQRIRWGERHREREVRTTTREDRIGDTGARQGEGKVDIVAHPIADEEVAPVFQAITRVVERGTEREVVIWPTETFTKPDASSKHLHVLVGIVVVGIVISTRVRAISIETIIVGITIIARVHVGVARIER